MYLKKAFTAVIVLTAFVLAQTARAENLPDFSELAAASGPAVVNINTERTANVSGPEDMFGDMFRNMPPRIRPLLRRSLQQQGTEGSQAQAEVPGLRFPDFR